MSEARRDWVKAFSLALLAAAFVGLFVFAVVILLDSNETLQQVKLNQQLMIQILARQSHGNSQDSNTLHIVQAICRTVGCRVCPMAGCAP